MGTELIAAWIYKNGELVKQRMKHFFLAIAVIIALLLTFTLAWPMVSSGVPFFKKAVSWKILLFFFTSVTILYYILKLFSDGIFLLYKKIIDPENEEILFTSNKITSTKKTWILNDESRKLVSVQFRAAKKKELVFKGTVTKMGSHPANYTIYIPVPVGELRNAEKIYNYFK
jgi:putative transposon-encoded protein